MKYKQADSEKISYYDKVLNLVKSIPAMESYKGYTGANARSLYMRDIHGINVNADNEAQRAFCDACDHEINEE